MIEIREFESASRSWPRHWHEEMEVIASVSGNSRHKRRGSGEYVAPGDVVLTAPGVVHTTVAERDHRWRFVAVHLPPALFDRFRDENDGKGSLAFSFFRSVLQCRGIYRHVLSLNQAVRDERSPLCCDHRLQELIHALWCESREPLLLPETTADRRIPLKRARDYLHEHFREKIAIRQLANIAGLSEFHFCRQFTRYFTVSPHSYQVQLRLLEVKKLLNEGATVAEAAHVVGFYSSSHLIRTFARVNGETPARFKKQQDFARNSFVVNSPGIWRL